MFKMFYSFATSFMESAEKNILDDIRQLFINYGIKSLTMDDIAKNLGISKKTLYISFKNKKDVVNKVTKHQITCDQCDVESMIQEGENAIDELLVVSKKLNEEFAKAHPSLLYDIQKYYPTAWKKVIEHKEQFVFNKVLRNIERGVKEGFYRKNLQPKVIAKAYIIMTDAMMSNKLAFQGEYSFLELHQEIMRYHILGIANNKGREYLKQKFEQEN